jgi:ATP-dependent protease ClpP protease subunit
MSSVALVFSGPTNYPATKNLRNVLCGFGSCLPNPAHGGAIFETVYLLLNSEGGSIEEAFSLYNLIRALPAEFNIVNMGQIASAANILFLAGDNRYCCDHSYFHFHNLSFFYDKPQNLHRIQMQDHSQIVDMERELYLQIVKQRTDLTDADIEALKFLEEPMVKDTDFALQYGFIQQVGMPALPANIPILNIDY